MLLVVVLWRQCGYLWGCYQCLFFLRLRLYIVRVLNTGGRSSGFRRVSERVQETQRERPCTGICTKGRASFTGTELTRQRIMTPHNRASQPTEFSNTISSLPFWSCEIDWRRNQKANPAVVVRIGSSKKAFDDCLFLFFLQVRECNIFWVCEPFGQNRFYLLTYWERHAAWLLTVFGFHVVREPLSRIAYFDTHRTLLENMTNSITTQHEHISMSRGRKKLGYHSQRACTQRRPWNQHHKHRVSTHLTTRVGRGRGFRSVRALGSLGLSRYCWCRRLGGNRGSVSHDGSFRLL